MYAALIPAILHCPHPLTLLAVGPRRSVPGVHDAAGRSGLPLLLLDAVRVLHPRANGGKRPAQLVSPVRDSGRRAAHAADSAVWALPAAQRRAAAEGCEVGLRGRAMREEAAPEAVTLF